MSAKPLTTMAVLVAPLAACFRFMAGRTGHRQVPSRLEPAPADWGDRIQVLGLTKQEAEDLLDWLEGQAIDDYQVSYTSGKGFCVSYRGKGQ